MNATKNGIDNCPNCKAVDEVIIENAFLEAFRLLADRFDDVLQSVLNTIEDILKDDTELNIVLIIVDVVFDVVDHDIVFGPLVGDQENVVVLYFSEHVALIIVISSRGWSSHVDMRMTVEPHALNGGVIIVFEEFHHPFSEFFLVGSNVSS